MQHRRQQRAAAGAAAAASSADTCHHAGVNCLPAHQCRSNCLPAQLLTGRARMLLHIPDLPLPLLPQPAHSGVGGFALGRLRCFRSPLVTGLERASSGASLTSCRDGAHFLAAASYVTQLTLRNSQHHVCNLQRTLAPPHRAHAGRMPTRCAARGAASCGAATWLLAAAALHHGGLTGSRSKHATARAVAPALAPAAAAPAAPQPCHRARSASEACDLRIKQLGGPTAAAPCKNDGAPENVLDCSPYFAVQPRQGNVLS